MFATQHRLHVVRVSEVVARRFATERLIERIAESRLPTNHGVFTAIGYRRKFDHPTECLALSYGESAAPPMWLCFRNASRATLWDPLAADAAATSTKRWHRLSNADAAFSSTSGVPPHKPSTKDPAHPCRPRTNTWPARSSNHEGPGTMPNLVIRVRPRLCAAFGRHDRPHQQQTPGAAHNPALLIGLFMRSCA